MAIQSLLIKFKNLENEIKNEKNLEFVTVMNLRNIIIINMGLN